MGRGRLGLGCTGQLVGGHDESEPLGAPPQAHVERDYPRVEQSREREILGVVRFRPAQFCGYTHRGHGQVGGSTLADLELSCEEALERTICKVAGDFAAERHLVEYGRHLTPEKAGSNQFLIATEQTTRMLALSVQGELDYQRCIDNEHVISVLRASDGQPLLHPASARP